MIYIRSAAIVVLGHALSIVGVKFTQNRQPLMGCQIALSTKSQEISLDRFSQNSLIVSMDI